MNDFTLPPPMGFPQEAYCSGFSFVPYYTCLIGPWRIYVYHPGGIVAEGWIVERKAHDPSLTPHDQFFNHTGEEERTTFHMPVADPLVCMTIIMQITSESNDDANPTGTDEDVQAPHV